MLEFDEAAHVYRIHGAPVPSVTQVLKPLESFARVPLDALENARLRGGHIHLAMALLARDDLDWMTVDESLREYVQSGERFLLDSGITVVASEMRVCSPRLRCAGTIDLIGDWRGRAALFDFKATAVIPPTVGPQTAGYEYLYREHCGQARRRMLRFCVHLQPGSYRVIPLEDSRDESVFLSALNIYHWGRQHGIAA